MTPKLTSQQIATVRTAILADPAASALMAAADDINLAAWLNTEASPTYYVYKTFVRITEIGDVLNASEVVGLTALNLQRLQALTGDLSGGDINPSIDDRRAGFAQIFSGAGGNQTRPALEALWRRPATRIEKLLATGTGSINSPAKTSTVGPCSFSEASDIRVSG